MKLVFDPIDFQTEIQGVPVAIKFREEWMQIDPRANDQKVITCYVRTLTGPKQLFVGAAVLNPNDRYELSLYGKKLALARALESTGQNIPTKAYWSMARHVVREWLKEQADREALEAVQQELERLEAAKAANGRSPNIPTEGELPGGPVSQFIGK
jgi:hypothetical protein